MSERGEQNLALSALWHQISKIDRVDPSLSVRASWGDWDRLPAPGYVGVDYKKHRLLFIGKNPGNGSASGPRPIEVTYFQALLKLRESSTQFEHFCTVHAEAIREWDVWRYPSEIGIAPEECAFINLLKWRGTPNKAMKTASWPLTRDQIDVLNPSIIVILGSTTFDMFRSVSIRSVKAQIQWIERTNGDKWTTPKALSQMKELRRYLNIS